MIVRYVYYEIIAFIINEVTPAAKEMIIVFKRDNFYFLDRIVEILYLVGLLKNDKGLIVIFFLLACSKKHERRKNQENRTFSCIDSIPHNTPYRLEENKYLSSLILCVLHHKNNPNEQNNWV